MHASLKLVGAALLAAGIMSGTAQAQQGQPAQSRPAAPAPAAADPNQPAATTATYQDWLVRCVTQAETGRVCEVVQNLQMQGQGLVASIAVGRTDPKAPMSLVIQVPQGVWLPTGVKFLISEKSKPLALEYKKCAQACVAEVQLDAATVQAMKTATENGSFTFDDGAKRAVSLPISFKGFAPALDASLKP